MTQSRITQFYQGDAPDHRGRLLEQLQSQTLDGLERTHDYIQWLFPLTEKGSANPHAPVLSPADIQAFAESEELRSHLVRSLDMMLRFYGLELSEMRGRIGIRRGESFERRSQVWLTPFNHNFLRMTRMLRCLKLLGCDAYAAALFNCLEGIYREHHATIGEETFRYWKAARG